MKKSQDLRKDPRHLHVRLRDTALCFGETWPPVGVRLGIIAFMMMLMMMMKIMIIITIIIIIIIIIIIMV